MVKRYDMYDEGFDNFTMREFPDGDYVTYENYERLETFVKLCRDGFFVDEDQLKSAADRILKE